MDADAIVLLSIFGAIISIIIDYLIANRFYQIAEEKGYHDRAYFWYAFLFTVAGYLMVVALPDRAAQKDEPRIVPDELPDL